MRIGDQVVGAAARLDVELAAHRVPGVGADHDVGAVQLLDDLAGETLIDELGHAGAVGHRA